MAKRRTNSFRHYWKRVALTTRFTPSQMVKILDRDMKTAGIPKKDSRGRTIDMHALRHTFGTHLSKGGVAPRTTQAAMRHSKIDLTMNVYTDTKLLDVHGAMDVLPQLPLDKNWKVEKQTQQATGTDSKNSLAPLLAPTLHKRGHLESSADKQGDISTTATQSQNQST